MEQIRQWYILYTKAGHEQKVCEALRRKKLESFFPANRVIKTIYGLEKNVLTPIIERYVFVFLSDPEFSRVKSTDGILNFVHWRTKPVLISEEDIYLLKRFTNTHNNISFEKTGVKINESASLVSLPTADENIDIVHLDLPVLGYKLTARENKARIKVITIPEYQTKTSFRSFYAKAR